MHKLEDIKKYSLGHSGYDGGTGTGTGGIDIAGKKIKTSGGVVNGQATSGDLKKVKGDKTKWIEFYFI